MKPLPQPEFTSLLSGEVHLYWGHVGAALEFSANNLSESELERAQVFRFERDRNAFLARRACLRLLLGRHSGLDPADLSIESGPHGKPFLAQDPGLCFNSSNSSDRFLIAISRGLELGVDLQEHVLGDSPRKLAAGVFTPGECAQLAEAQDACQRDLFLTGWTRKEAALKALGTGFMQEARELHVGLGAPLDPARPWQVPGEPKLAGQRLLDLGAPEGFSAALCVEGSAWTWTDFQVSG